MAFQINWDDPRFQRKLQEAWGKHQSQAIEDEEYKGLYSDFAKQQLAFGAQMQTLQLQEKVHEDNLALSEQRLAFQQEQFNERMRMQRKELRGTEKAANLQYGLGFGTSILAGYYGNERRKKIEAETEKQKQRNKRIDKYLGIGE